MSEFTEEAVGIHAEHSTASCARCGELQRENERMREELERLRSRGGDVNTVAGMGFALGVVVLGFAPIVATWLESHYLEWTMNYDYWSYVAYGAIFGSAWSSWSVLICLWLYWEASLGRRIMVAGLLSAYTIVTWLAFSESSIDGDFADFFQILFMAPLVAMGGLVTHVAPTQHKQHSIRGLLGLTFIAACTVRWIQSTPEGFVDWDFVLLLTTPAIGCALHTNVVLVQVLGKPRSLTANLVLLGLSILITPLGMFRQRDDLDEMLVFYFVLYCSHLILVTLTLSILQMAKRRFPGQNPKRPGGAVVADARS